MKKRNRKRIRELSESVSCFDEDFAGDSFNKPNPIQMKKTTQIQILCWCKVAKLHRMRDLLPLTIWVPAICIESK